MEKKRIDPAVWLAEHNPGESSTEPFLYSTDVLRIGADELARCGGDLSRALARSDCQAEIILAWLAARVAEDGPVAATDGIMIAARIVGRLNAQAGVVAACQHIQNFV